MFGRIAAFVYGVASYVVCLAAFAYAAGFLGNFAVPKSIDSGPQAPLAEALLVNIGLIALFAVPHSVMARPWFKARWKRIVPEPVERSTYVLVSSILFLVMFWKWEPIGGVLVQVEAPIARMSLTGMYIVGWALLLLSTFLINHFDLFGLRQVWFYLRGKKYTPLGFRTPWLYRYVRHPLYVGWFLVFWATPVMTIAHLVFAVGTTAYIFIALQYEERDLERFHPEYARYRNQVPRFIPIGPRAKANEQLSAAGD